MTLAEFLEKFGRTIFEGPFTWKPGDEPPELAEIRIAVLEQAQEKSHRAGGRKVFPYNLLHIHLRGIEDSRAPMFTGKFFRAYIEQEMRQSLDKSECRYPQDLRVEVHATRDLPASGEPWVWLEIEFKERPEAAPPGPAARLVVMAGKANEARISLSKGRTNIGRAVDVYRSEGLLRRNDLAFTEDTEINRTVSREHAHIERDSETGEYRLYNDRWYKRDEAGACGLWIFRNGLSQEVHRTARGTKLEPGDEIHLGKAVVRFQVK